jgi:ferredoxin
LALAAIFQVTRDYGLDSVVNGTVAPAKIELTPERASEKVKGLATQMGADLVRIGPLNQAYVYTNKGKLHGMTEGTPRGTPIQLRHKHSIVIAEGLDLRRLKGAPKLQSFAEIARAYAKLAVISVAVARFIRSLGYPARAHNLRNYQVIIPPVAIEAGIGELGRHGVMVTREFGSALKMAVVTTDLPLLHDRKTSLNVDDFCKHCKLCAENCPSGAISYGDKKIQIRGYERYRFNPEACYKIWNESGTDCGVCIATCPWAKSPSLHHRVGTWMAMRSGKFPLFARFLVWMERVTSGSHNPGKFPPPSWMEEPDPVWKKYKFGRRKKG